MAYVNVAEWNAFHVGKWLIGLDDSILPYVQFFVNNQINGCRLLLMSANDLDRLNIYKVGHQEIILEAVELLRQLHYNFCSETLQTIALRLACKSRSLFNQLRHLAAAAAAVAAAEAAASNSASGGSSSSSNSNDGQHRHNHHHHNHGSAQSNSAQSNNSSTNAVDMSPVSTATLASVSEILGAVKDFISWIDRYPFDGQDRYIAARKSILQLSVELASTAQRDKFVQAPNEVIRTSCKKLADICDRLVQELTDPLAMQAATLEVVIVSKNLDEELGMHIHSSYSGVHVVGGLKHQSPVFLHKSIEEGDEIVQVNYQTVVGWQLKKLVSFMRQFPIKIILTVKKRPQHFTNFNLLSPFSLPTPDYAIQSQQQQQQPQQQQSVPGNHLAIHHLNYPFNIPPPQQPIPLNNSSNNYQEYSVINPGSINHSSFSSSTSADQMLYSQIPAQAQQYSMSTACGSGNSSGSTVAQSPPTPPLKTGGPIYSLQRSSSTNGPSGTAGTSSSSSTSTSKSNRNTLKKTLNKLACVGGGGGGGSKSNKSESSSSSRKMTPPASSFEGPLKPVSKLSQTIITRQAAPSQSSPQQQQQQQQASTSQNKRKTSKIVGGSGGNSGCKSEPKMKSRVATTRCSSASDSSPLSDSTSTLFSSSDDYQDDDDDDDNEKCPGSCVGNQNQNSTRSSRTRQTTNCNRFHGKKQQSTPRNSGCGCRPRPIVDSDCAALKDSCSGKDQDNDSDAVNDNDDNDSAFYSGRTTSANDISHSSVTRSADREQQQQQPEEEEEENQLKQVESTILNSLARVSLREAGMIANEHPLYDVDYHRVHSNELEEDEQRKSSRGVNSKKNSSKIIPRTSAEFEALYQQKKNSLDSIGDTVHSSSGASNCSGSNSGCEGTNNTNNNNKSASPLSSTGQSQHQHQLTQAQLTTISHLTHLAKNIRFANTAPVIANVVQPSSSTSHSKSLSSSGSDSALISRINESLERLTNGNLVMGNHEDHLYIYKGNGADLNRNPAQIGNSSASSAAAASASDRLPFSTTGSLLTVDRSNPAHWSRIRAVLRDNCLHLYSDPSAPSTACVELPVHLPGYYILINKDDLLNSDARATTTVPLSENQTDCSIEDYFQFTLVTYHRLFTFAVDQAAKLAIWIARFGYRYCCNPKESQLCFNYYLSPVHVSGIGISKRPNTSLASGPSQTVQSNSKISSGMTSLARTNSNKSNDEASDARVDSSGSGNNNNNNNLPDSELESDDYHDLMMSSASSMSNVDVSGYNVVKFGDFTSIIGSGSGCGGGFDESCITEDCITSEDARRFIKSPHPRGSARFAVRPRANEEQFIDSIVDAKSTMASSLAASVNHQPATSTAPICPDLDYDFPQKNPSLCLSLTVSLNEDPDSTSCKTAGSSSQQPIIMNQHGSQTSTKHKSPNPPELPPRVIALSPSVSSRANPAAQPPSSPTIIDNCSVPRPKPRISKMSVTGLSTPSEAIAPSGTTVATTLVSSVTRSSVSKPTKQSNSGSISSSSSSSLRMAPIPVPEKSAAISQTIQHFANLQRQNNLRRSFANSQNGSSVAINELSIAAASAVASMGQKNFNGNGDYDYISTTNQPNRTVSGGLSKPLNQTAKPEPIAPKPTASSSSSNINNGVGNPIYCHLPRSTLDCYDIEPSEPDVVSSSSSGSGSVLDQEYSRLYGDRKPSAVKSASASDQSQPESGVNQPEDDDQSLDLSLPPPQLPPPQPPPIIRNCLMKGQQSSLSVEGEQQDDTEPLVVDSSFAKHVASPKMAKRTKNKKDQTRLEQSNLKLELADSTVETMESSETVPVDTRHTTQEDGSSVPSKHSLPSPIDSCPPTLLPRRSATGPQKTPPPLPTTSHPLLAKTNSASSVSQSQSASDPSNQFPLTTDGSTTTTTSGSNNNKSGSKQLNRSYSDAYAQRPPGRARPRKSLEGGAGTGTGLAQNGRLDENDESFPVFVGGGGGVVVDSSSSGGLLLHQSPQQQQQFQQNGGDLSNSNRSLPTMGVSMLGKKRLSNVSADCHAIEKAISLFERGQNYNQHQRRSSSGNCVAGPEDLRNNNNNNNNNNNQEESEAAWAKIDQTLSETKQRLLNH